MEMDKNRLTNLEKDLIAENQNLDRYIEEVKKYSETASAIQAQIDKIRDSMKPIKVTPIIAVGLVLYFFTVIYIFQSGSYKDFTITGLGFIYVIYRLFPHEKAYERRTASLRYKLEQEMKSLEYSLQKVADCEKKIKYLESMLDRTLRQN